MNVRYVPHAKKEIISARIQRRAEGSTSTPRKPTPAATVARSTGAARTEARTQQAITAGMVCAALQDRMSASTPASGLTTIQARAFAPTTWPIAHARSSPGNVATPAKPADSRQAKPTPISAWTVRKAVREGESAAPTLPAMAMSAPHKSSGRTPSRSRNGAISSDDAIAAPASAERAWPTAPTDAPNSRPASTIVGARTTSNAWEAIVDRTSGRSRRTREEALFCPLLPRAGSSVSAVFEPPVKLRSVFGRRPPTLRSLRRRPPYLRSSHPAAAQTEPVSSLPALPSDQPKRLRSTSRLISSRCCLRRSNLASMISFMSLTQFLGCSLYGGGTCLRHAFGFPPCASPDLPGQSSFRPFSQQTYDD